MALIITVIVLLVLAGVVINMTVGNEGIIGKAQSAVDMYKNAQEKEEYEIAKITNEIDSNINGNREQIMVDKEIYEKLLQDVEDLKNNSLGFADYSATPIHTLNSYNQSWTATENCVANVTMCTTGNSSIVYVNGVQVFCIGGVHNANFTNTVYLKKGDVISTRNDNNGQTYDIKIYPVQ